MGSFSIIALFERFALLGAEWVMWLLVVMGFVALVLFFVRLYFFNRYSVDVDQLVKRLNRSWIETCEGAPTNNQIEDLHCGHPDSMELSVVRGVVEAFEQDNEQLDHIMQKIILTQRPLYERHLPYFGIVGSNAPFIGLFGTVIGVIISFKELGENPKGGLEVVGPGISEALVATAVGLLVAIPAVIMFNYLKSKMRGRIQNSELVYRHLLALKGSPEA